MAASAEILRSIETLPVTLSERFVSSTRLGEAVPAGFRIATLEEVAARYVHDMGFREELYRKGAVWTNQVGLDGSGYREISTTGKFLRINDENYPLLSAERKAAHHPGTGQVVVYVYDMHGKVSRRLVVSAGSEPSFGARVAMVPLGKNDEAEAEVVEIDTTTVAQDKINSTGDVQNVQLQQPAWQPHIEAFDDIIRQ